MPFHGSIVVIKRSGSDGSVFPLVNGECLMGRAEGCDIRVQLAVVSDEHCRIEINENDEARLICLSEQIGQTQVNGKSIKTGASQTLYHKSIFSVGDRQFRWEYPDHSKHLQRKPESSIRSSARPNILTPNNGQETKATTPRTKGEAHLAAAKAVEAAVTAVVASATIEGASQGSTPVCTSSKRVSFGPYVSPEIIDKSLPPSTPVKKGAAPLNMSVDGSTTGSLNISSAKLSCTPKRMDTPSSLLKRKMKKKISQNPVNESISEEAKPGVLKRKPNDTPMVKDNSGYRASPRRLDALVSKTPDAIIKLQEKTPKDSAAATTKKSPKQVLPLTKVSTTKKELLVGSSPTKTTRLSPKGEKSPKPVTPKGKMLSKAKLTKSAIKKPAGAFYGAAAAPTPKGSKRRASDIKGTSQAKKLKLTKSPKSRAAETPVKPASYKSKKSLTPKRKLTLTKSTVKIRPTTAFYGTSVANTPKGAKPNKRLASPIAGGAKKAKLSTPKGTPKDAKSPKKSKTPASLKPIRQSQAPRSVKVQKKAMSFSEVVKKGSLKRAIPLKANRAQKVLTKFKHPSKTSKSTPSLKSGKLRKWSSSSTGHISSPDAIIIRRKVKTTTPKVLAKKGRKTPYKIPPHAAKQTKETNFEGMAELLKTPAVKKSKTPPKQAPRIEITSPTPVRKLNSKATPKSVVQQKSITPKVTKASPKSTKKVPRVTPSKLSKSLLSSPPRTPDSARGLNSRSKSFTETPNNLNNTSFDFDAMKTPAIPLETFVSPLTSGKNSSRRMSFAKTPDMRGVRKLIISPKSQKTPKMGGIKQMLITPKNSKTPDMVGLKKMLNTPKDARTPRMRGLKQLLTTPKDVKTPDMRGLKKMLNTPKTAKSPDMRGLKQLLTTPKDAKSPRMSGLKEMLNTPKDVKTPDMRGLKKMLNTPKSARTPRMAGIKQMFISPKAQGTPSYEGLSALIKTPSPKKLSPEKPKSSRKEKEEIPTQSEIKRTSRRQAEAQPSPAVKSPPKPKSRASTKSSKISEHETSPGKVVVSPKQPAGDNEPSKVDKFRSPKSPVKRVTRRRAVALATSPIPTLDEVASQLPTKEVLGASPTKRVSRSKDAAIILIKSPSKSPQKAASPIKRVSRSRTGQKPTTPLISADDNLSEETKPKTNILPATPVKRSTRRGAALKKSPSKSPQKVETPIKGISRSKAVQKPTTPQTSTDDALNKGIDSPQAKVSTSPIKRSTRRRGADLKKSPSKSPQKVLTPTKRVSRSRAAQKPTTPQAPAADSPKKGIDKPSLKVSPVKRSHRSKGIDAIKSPSKSPQKVVSPIKRASRSKAVQKPIIPQASAGTSPKRKANESSTNVSPKKKTRREHVAEKLQSPIPEDSSINNIRLKGLSPKRSPEKVPRKKRAAASNIGSMKELPTNKKLRRGDSLTSVSSDTSTDHAVKGKLDEMGSSPNVVEKQKSPMKKATPAKLRKGRKNVATEPEAKLEEPRVERSVHSPRNAAISPAKSSAKKRAASATKEKTPSKRSRRNVSSEAENSTNESLDKETNIASEKKVTRRKNAKAEKEETKVEPKKLESKSVQSNKKQSSNVKSSNENKSRSPKKSPKARKGKGKAVKVKKETKNAATSPKVRKGRTKAVKFTEETKKAVTPSPKKRVARSRK